jgi:hypothetical protein
MLMLQEIGQLGIASRRPPSGAAAFVVLALLATLQGEVVVLK